jgi:hypothetical protein
MCIVSCTYATGCKHKENLCSYLKSDNFRADIRINMLKNEIITRLAGRPVKYIAVAQRFEV